MASGRLRGLALRAEQLIGSRGSVSCSQDSIDHVAVSSASNIVELAERADLVLLSWRGVRLKTMFTPRGRAQAGVRRALLSGGLSPESACETLIFECGHPKLS